MLQSCHLRGGCNEGKGEVGLDVELGHLPTLTAMEDETGKSSEDTKARVPQKRCPLKLISLKMPIVHNLFTVHCRKVDIEARHWWIIRRPHEWNLRCTACGFD